MNILFVSAKKKWGGVVSLQVRVAEELQRRGHSVWMISARHSALTDRAPAGLPLVVRKFGMDFNPALIVWLCRLIRRRRIDIVVTNIKKEIIAGGIAARLSRIPCIRIIGNEKDFNDSRFLQRSLVDHYIVPCRTTQEIAASVHSWLQREDIVVIHNGHNAAAYDAAEIAALRQRWGLRNDELAIGVTARLVRSKGIGFLIESFAGIAGQRPRARLIITGEGRFRDEFEALTTSLHMEQQVHFAGFACDPVLSASSYDIAVLPSDAEAFPYAIVEYFAAGRPVIATRVGGVEEIMQDGRNGLLVEARNRRQMSDALLLLIDDEGKRKELGRAALETLRRDFTQDVMIDRFEKTFAESRSR